MNLRDSDFDEDYDEPSDEDEGGEDEDEEAADFALPPREPPLWFS